MGFSLLSIYREKIKKEWKTAFFSTVIVFLLIHLFNVDHIMSTYEKGAALNDFL